MANTESDRKEKSAEVLGENALDGIAGGGGEGMEAGLNHGNEADLEECAERIKQVEQFVKSSEDATRKIRN